MSNNKDRSPPLSRRQTFSQITRNRFSALILLFAIFYTVVILVLSTLNVYEYKYRVLKQPCGEVDQRPQVVMFDLDDTLYWSPQFSKQIDDNVLEYLVKRLNIPEAEAQNIRGNLYRQHGTTLAALVELGYKVNITDYHQQVFQLPYEEHLQANISMLNTIRGIVLPKFIFTNGNNLHTEKALTALGFNPDDFDGIISFDSLMGQYLDKDGYVDAKQVNEVICKPKQQAFENALEVARKRLGISQLCPQQVVFIDDSKRNIKAANSLNLKAVLVIYDKDTSCLVDMESMVVTSLEQLRWKMSFLF